MRARKGGFFSPDLRDTAGVRGSGNFLTRTAGAARACGILSMIMTAIASQTQAFSPGDVRAAMRPLALDSGSFYPSPVIDYFKYYGLDFKGAAHWFGTYGSDTFALAAHVFMPATPCATLLAVHGYYDHAGILSSIIGMGIDAGYAVAAIDLPGHGLSSGPRSSIQDFAQYGRAIGDFFRQYGGRLPRPWVLAGHSTGCAAIMEYLHIYGEKGTAQAIFCAPLVRSILWHPSRIGYWLAIRWLKKTIRWFRNNSSDRCWVAWYRHEPLQEVAFPTQWATAYYAWEARLNSYAPFELPVTVIQGTKDESLDWRRNMEVLRQRCRHINVRLIEGARHHLPNEGGKARREFERLFTEALKKASIEHDFLSPDNKRR